MLTLLAFAASAQSSSDYTHGVEFSGNAAVVWFKSNVDTQWADIHYALAGGSQQNLRMTWNGSKSRHEQAITPAAQGQALAYSFTYNNGTPAYDTAWFSTTVGSGGNGGGSGSGKVCFYEHVDYAGASFCADADSNWVGTDWNDRVSSVKVQSGYQVQLFADINHGGGSVTISGNEPNLVGRGFNDQMSAFKVQVAGGGGGSGTWNERTTFKIANQTRGRWANQDIYWSIIGKSWKTGQFVWVNAQGQQIPMAVGDNGALVKNGEGYTNYFHRLSDVPQMTIDPINSARILLSVGSPMYIKVVVDVNGNLGYAGANIQNPSDPNLDVYFDFGEMAIIPKDQNDSGIFVNTTRVDHFGFPLQLRVQGLDGYDRTVGENVAGLTRDQVFQRFVERVPGEFKHLAQTPYAPYRIVAPGHGNFNYGKANASYLQAYIDSVWSRYRNENISFTLQNLGTFTGRVQGDTFRFTGGNQNGTFYINGKPDTQMVLLGAGLLADAANAAPQDIGTQLQIQAQFAAALNRHVLEMPAQWYNAAYHYPSGQRSNWYAWFWHNGDISHDGKAYGFSYDDVGDHATLLYAPAPTTVTYTIGW
ncbi:beta-1,3-glucanase family protein [Stenotrophomonas daejeonensis]|uniref:beta-1,3-glucanase family protein n=1 Tax=Stenotrophomonas daejeonensis TaxID=659018 RepID=UPI00070DDED6|nr:beta-1,3-glucanase family protein [Stenotrophomonas daejeonensis]